MKINIFGMGYVGCVTAACLAKNGHEVTGIDVAQEKLDMINMGKSPIVEPGLDKAIGTAVQKGKLKADTVNMNASDVSIVCVGTPSNGNGTLGLTFITRVSEQIGDYLRKANFYHTVNIRSTVLPGTVENIIIPILEQRSGKKAGTHFGVCMNPEFMREGTAIHDFYNPPFTLVGELDDRSGTIVSDLYKDINAPIIRANIKVAEMVKYATNAFHALKVTFANEIGNICKKLTVDSHEVMDIVCKDTKLNLSAYYMKPGFAFGGSCLPKDLRAIPYKAKQLDLECEVLSSILRSNKNQIDIAYDTIKNTGKKSVGFLGLSFKPETDDLRESPYVELIEKLIGKGYEVNIYDKEVSLAKIFGSNKKYINLMIPHISSLLKESLKDVIEKSEVIVIGKDSQEFDDTILKVDDDKNIIDLTGISNRRIKARNYEGICW